MIKNIKNVFYQIPLRLNNFFPNFHRPIGLWIYGLLLGTNMYSLFNICVYWGLLEEKSLYGLVQLTAILIFFIEIYYTWKFDNFLALMKREKKKGKSFNQFWDTITLIYVLLSIFLIIITIII